MNLIKKTVQIHPATRICIDYAFNFKFLEDLEANQHYK